MRDYKEISRTKPSLDPSGNNIPLGCTKSSIFVRNLGRFFILGCTGAFLATWEVLHFGLQWHILDNLWGFAFFGCDGAQSWQLAMAHLQANFQPELQFEAPTSQMLFVTTSSCKISDYTFSSSKALKRFKEVLLFESMETCASIEAKCAIKITDDKEVTK